MKKTLWNTILKVVIAITIALTGILGGQAIMS